MIKPLPTSFAVLVLIASVTGARVSMADTMGTSAPAVAASAPSAGTEMDTVALIGPHNNLIPIVAIQLYPARPSGTSTMTDMDPLLQRVALGYF